MLPLAFGGGPFGVSLWWPSGSMAPVAAKAPAPACNHDSPSLYDSLSPHPHQVTADIERTLLPLPSSFLDERRWERSPVSTTTRASTTNPIPSLSSHDKETVYQRTIFTHPRRQPDQTAGRINRRDERRDTIRGDRGGIVLKRPLRALRALIVVWNRSSSCSGRDSDCGRHCCDDGNDID